jgi:hypothetical protein
LLGRAINGLALMFNAHHLGRPHRSEVPHGEGHQAEDQSAQNAMFHPSPFLGTPIFEPLITHDHGLSAV